MSLMLFLLVVSFTLFVGWYFPRADWGRLNFIRDDGAARLIVELLTVLVFIVILSAFVLVLTPFLYDLFNVYE